MQVLVFGGSGFLGSRLLPMLRQRGHQLLAPRSRDLDLTNDVTEWGAYENVDAVVHAAALYGGMPFDIENQALIFATNTRINLNVFEFCRRVQPRELITIGSACSYPGYVDHPLGESDLFHGPLHATVECHGFTKLWMVAAHRAYEHVGVRGIHLIPANLYGPGDVYNLRRAHVVAALIKKYTDAVDGGGDVELMGDGSPIREFLYIDDLADVILRAIERLDHEPAPINVGTGVGHSIRELAALIGDHVGFHGKTIWNRELPNGAQQKVMNIDRMQQLLGPVPITALPEGIHRTLAWYRERKREADLRA